MTTMTIRPNSFFEPLWRLGWQLGQWCGRGARLRAACHKCRSAACPLRDEVLVIAGDHAYREQVLIPSLESVGVAKLRRAAGPESAMRQLRRYPSIGTVVMDDVVVAKGAEFAELCCWAKVQGLRVVVLSNFARLDTDLWLVVDKVIDKSRSSVLECVREVAQVVAR